MSSSTLLSPPRTNPEHGDHDRGYAGGSCGSDDEDDDDDDQAGSGPAVAVPAVLLKRSPSGWPKATNRAAAATTTTIDRETGLIGAETEPTSAGLEEAETRKVDRGDGAAGSKRKKKRDELEGGGKTMDGSSPGVKGTKTREAAADSATTNAGPRKRVAQKDCSRNVKARAQGSALSRHVDQAHSDATPTRGAAACLCYSPTDSISKKPVTGHTIPRKKNLVDAATAPAARFATGDGGLSSPGAPRANAGGVSTITQPR